jgi:hypothetical protein
MTERTGTVIVTFGWLIGCVVAGVICFWYPVYVDSKFGPEADSRMGFFYLGAFPYMIGAGVVAVLSLARLFRALRGAGTRNFASLFSLGIILTLASLSPVAVIGFRLIYGLILYALWNHQHG